MALSMPKSKKKNGTNEKLLKQIMQLRNRHIDRKIYKKGNECHLEDIMHIVNKSTKCLPGTDDFKKMIKEFGFHYNYRKTNDNLINISLKSKKIPYGYLIQIPNDINLCYKSIIILLASIDFDQFQFKIIIDPQLKFALFLKILKEEKKNLYEHIVLEIFNKNRIIII